MIRTLAFLMVLVLTTSGRGEDEPSFGNRTASEWVTILQTDKSPRKREGAVLALSQIGTTSRPILPALRTALRDDKAANVRRRIVGVFGIVKREELGPIVSDLAEVLKRDPDATVRAAAVNALGQFGDAAKPALPALIGSLKDPDTLTRAAAAEAVGRVGIEARSAIPDLLPLLKDPDKTVRLYATFALGRVGADSATVAELASLLSKDMAPEVRKEVARSIGLMGMDAKPGVPALVAAMSKDMADEVRQEAMLALMRLGTVAQEASPAIIEAMSKDKDKSVRAFAVRAIVIVLGANAKNAVPEMAAALEKEEIGDVKLAIIEELGAMGPEAFAAIPALMNAQKDVQLSVRDAAAAALKKIRVKK